MYESETEKFARERFAEFSADHVLTVLHDEGMYRHIRMAKPGTRIWSWDLITWPGNLVITGDLATYTFSRDHDMFEFFKIGRTKQIDFRYWAEKIQNHAARDSTRVYSATEAKRAVIENFWEQRLQWNDKLLPVWTDLKYALLDDYILEDEHAFRVALRDWHHGEFHFSDTWEWDVTDWNFQFLLACHAIAHGIRAYDEYKENNK